MKIYVLFLFLFLFFFLCLFTTTKKASKVCWLYDCVSHYEEEINLNFRDMILNLIKDGKIVPSEVTVKLLQKELESSNSSKFLIDGFPRTEENRVAFERIVSCAVIISLSSSLYL